MNRNRLPSELRSYLSVCEMNPHEMTDAQILEEARYVHSMHYEDGNCWNESKESDKRTLTRFIEREGKQLEEQREKNRAEWFETMEGMNDES